jgi:hypothetical protein
MIKNSRLCQSKIRLKPLALQFKMATDTYSSNLLRTPELQKSYISDNEVMAVTVIYYA